MIRLATLACLLLLGAAQDPADKVQALVEKLMSADIAVREAAAAELINLGAPALPAVRAHFDRARGDTRDQLEKIVRRLEIAERIASITAPGPLITLAAKDRPADEVLAEIRKQGGVI